MQKLRDSGLAGNLQTFTSSWVLSTGIFSCAWAAPENAPKVANRTKTFFMGFPLGVCKTIINHN